MSCALHCTLEYSCGVGGSLSEDGRVVTVLYTILDSWRRGDSAGSSPLFFRRRGVCDVTMVIAGGAVTVFL